MAFQKPDKFLLGETYEQYVSRALDMVQKYLRDSIASTEDVETITVMLGGFSLDPKITFAQMERIAQLRKTLGLPYYRQWQMDGVQVAPTDADNDEVTKLLEIAKACGEVRMREFEVLCGEATQIIQESDSPEVTEAILKLVRKVGGL